MKIKSRIGILGGIAVIAIIIMSGLFAWLLLSITRGGEELVTAFDNVKNTLPQIDKSRDSLSYVLNADRDAYQAYVARLIAASSCDRSEIDEQIASNNENIQQVWDRTIKGAENFSEETQGILAEFSREFPEWEKSSKESLNAAKERSAA